jgi:hypothetical protein
MSHIFVRFGFSTLLLLGLAGCGSKGGGGGGGGESNWFPGKGKWDLENGVLRYADFGTKFGIGGRPVVDAEQLASGRSVAHIATAKLDPTSKVAEYRALMRPAVKVGDPNPKKQALRLRAFVQQLYPFLNVSDGQTYIVGDRPAGQTEHIVAGSESTILFLEVDHNGFDESEAWIHRVYVLKATEDVYCWARQTWNEQPSVKATEVPENWYAEVLLKDGSWQIVLVEPIANNPDRQATANDIKTAAQGMGLPVP